MPDQLMDFNIYGYVPSLAAGIAFITVFSLLTIASIGLVAKSKIWWLLVLVVGGIGEVIGWAGRTWAAKQYRSLNAFLIQQICLILAPCFFSAALYGILGMAIRYLGPEHSRLRPGLYLVVFCLADLVAIVIQAIGGAMAAIALQNDESSDVGSHIMLAGIVCQAVAMVAFCVLGIDFYLRRRRAQRQAQANPVVVEKEFDSAPQHVGRPKERITLLSIGLVWTAFWILVRCFYRVAELAEGWGGYLIQHELYFIFLDSVPMVFTLAGFLVTWPSICLPDAQRFVSNKAADKAAVVGEFDQQSEGIATPVNSHSRPPSANEKV